MYLWAPVSNGYDTLINVQERWTIDDLADCHELLEIKAEMEEHARKQGNHATA